MHATRQGVPLPSLPTPTMAEWPTQVGGPVPLDE